MSPTDASLPPSSRRRQVSHIQALEVPESPDVLEASNSPIHVDESVPPQDDEAVEPGPSQAVEVDEPVSPQAFE